MIQRRTITAAAAGASPNGSCTTGLAIEYPSITTASNSHSHETPKVISTNATTPRGFAATVRSRPSIPIMAQFHWTATTVVSGANPRIDGVATYTGRSARRS
ncbi:hypothetical protein [Nocardia sp. NPDC004604]|uniref:hypothetical protein n=1 Tax=Nocardia sp. NPDC004604 TaxID=3157013 RepID=UPI00339EF902